jgi:chromosome segregation ATPase
VVVTRGGQCLSSDGTFEIGVPSTATGIVTRRSELRTLNDRHAELTRTVADTNAAIESLQAELVNLQQEIRRLQARRQQELETIASSRAEFDRLTREQTAGQDASSAAEAASLDAERKAASLAQAREEAAAAVAAHLSAVETARRELTDTQAALADVDRDRGEVLDEINRLRVERATCQERLARGRDALEARQSELDDRTRALEQARTEVTDPRLRSLIQKVEPTFRHHEQVASQLTLVQAKQMAGSAALPAQTPDQVPAEAPNQPPSE